MFRGRRREEIRANIAGQYILAGFGHLSGAWGPRAIVLLSSHRFGSSLMMNYLSAQPNIQRRGEILNPDEVVYGKLEGASRGRVITHIRATSLASRGRIAMVKLMDSQIEEHGLTLDDIISALYQPYIVAVYRRDLLSAYVSLLIAQQNGLWYSTDRVNEERISIELSALRNYVYDTRRRWTHYFARLRAYSRSISVAYEDFAERPEEEMNRIYDFLGSPRRGPVTETVRQNPWPLSSKIENYRELCLDELLTRGEFTLDLGLWQTGS
jgi:tRNA(Phe) wybutosine-synthesizing methylase Tyw3